MAIVRISDLPKQSAENLKGKEAVVPVAVRNESGGVPKGTYRIPLNDLLSESGISDPLESGSFYRYKSPDGQARWVLFNADRINKSVLVDAAKWTSGLFNREIGSYSFLPPDNDAFPESPDRGKLFFDAEGTLAMFFAKMLGGENWQFQTLASSGNTSSGSTVPDAITEKMMFRADGYFNTEIGYVENVYGRPPPSWVTNEGYGALAYDGKGTVAKIVPQTSSMQLNFQTIAVNVVSGNVQAPATKLNGVFPAQVGDTFDMPNPGYILQYGKLYIDNNGGLAVCVHASNSATMQVLATGDNPTPNFPNVLKRIYPYLQKTLNMVSTWGNLVGTLKMESGIGLQASVTIFTADALMHLTFSGSINNMSVSGTILAYNNAYRNKIDPDDYISISAEKPASTYYKIYNRMKTQELKGVLFITTELIGSFEPSNDPVLNERPSENFLALDYVQVVRNMKDAPSAGTNQYVRQNGEWVALGNYIKSNLVQYKGKLDAAAGASFEIYDAPEGASAGTLLIDSSGSVGLITSQYFTISSGYVLASPSEGASGRSIWVYTTNNSANSITRVNSNAKVGDYVINMSGTRSSLFGNASVMGDIVATSGTDTQTTGTIVGNIMGPAGGFEEPPIDGHYGTKIYGRRGTDGTWQIPDQIQGENGVGHVIIRDGTIYIASAGNEIVIQRDGIAIRTEKSSININRAQVNIVAPDGFFVNGKAIG
jgi:hypothetical protein